MNETNERSVASAGSHMELRDLFAAAALTGLLADPKCEAPENIIRTKWLPALAYGWADAMLKHRSNHPAKPDSSNDSEKPNSSSGRCSE